MEEGTFCNLCRVAEYVEKKSGVNMEHFRTSLQFVKLWAKNKGIYTNKMGFLGGISWAIMTAKICQVLFLYFRCTPINVPLIF
jgi:poly(A) polymerase